MRNRTVGLVVVSFLLVFWPLAGGGVAQEKAATGKWAKALKLAESQEVSKHTADQFRGLLNKQRQLHPSVPTRVWDILDKQLMAEAQTASAVMAQVLEANLTERELDEALAFFQTRVGKEYVALQRRFSPEAVAIQQQPIDQATKLARLQERWAIELESMLAPWPQKEQEYCMAFFESSAGEKLNDLSPSNMQQIQAWGKDAGERLKEKAREIVKQEQGQATIGGRLSAKPADNAKDTALLEASKKGDIGGINKSLADGAEVTCTDPEFNATPLHWAAFGGHSLAATLLLEKGAQVDALNKDGRTALMIAAGRGHDAAVNLLLQSKADKALRDGEGKTAWDLARERERWAVLRTLGQ